MQQPRAVDRGYGTADFGADARRFGCAERCTVLENLLQGATAHEFYLGDAEAQEDHGEEMADMGGEMHDEEDGIAVEPRATGTLEYTFEQAGEKLAGCHEPGHYEAGMVASMTVAGQ